jgi:hypothetical protein
LIAQTLAGWSERDIALQTGNLRGLEQLVPNVNRVRVPQATHWLNPAQPALRNALIREVVEGGENHPALQQVLAPSPPDTAQLS